jgi:hypothetical protein
MRLLLDFSPDDYRAWLEAQLADTTWTVLVTDLSGPATDPLLDFIAGHIGLLGRFDFVRFDHETPNSVVLSYESETDYVEAAVDLPDWCAPLADGYNRHVGDTLSLQDAVTALAEADGPWNKP